MADRVIFTDAVTGELRIIRPLKMTAEAILAREDGRFPSLPLDAINPMIVSWESTRKDRWFRNAWRQSGSEIQIDMERAREVHKENLESLAVLKISSIGEKIRLAELVGDTEKADALKEQETDLKAAALSIGSLDFDTPKTPEELKLVWPVDLPKE